MRANVPRSGWALSNASCSSWRATSTVAFIAVCKASKLTNGLAIHALSATHGESSKTHPIASTNREQSNEFNSAIVIE